MIIYKKFTSEILLKQMLPQKCSFCNRTEDENFDEFDGKLYPLAIAYRDQNMRNQKLRNLLLLCRRHAKQLGGRFLIKGSTKYGSFRGTGRL